MIDKRMDQKYCIVGSLEMTMTIRVPPVIPVPSRVTGALPRYIYQRIELRPWGTNR